MRLQRPKPKKKPKDIDELFRLALLVSQYDDRLDAISHLGQANFYVNARRLSDVALRVYADRKQR